MEIKVSIEDLRKNKLFVATPMYGGQCAGMYTRSIADLAALCTRYQIPLQIYYLFNESLITRARNYCVDEFLRSGATHLMFIDSDIGFDPNDVLALLALSSGDSDKHVIGGPYPKKCISWEKIIQAVNKGAGDKDPNNLERYVGDYVFNPRSSTREIPIGEPVEVMELGTGFMMIQRRVFDKYKEVYSHLGYKPDHVRTEHFDGSRFIHAYFDCVIDRGFGQEETHRLMQDILSGKDVEELKKEANRMIEAEKKASMRYLSEDYMFCYNVERMGMKVWLCPWMQLKHVGSYIFGGSLADLAAIGASATADPTKLNKKGK